MSADPNKKTARTFQCRDALWETFEQIARELECSVDYLVNEAMKQYARQRAQGALRTPYPPTRPEPSQPIVASTAPSSPAGRVTPPPVPPPMAPPLPPPPARPPPAVQGRGSPSIPMPPPPRGVPTSPSGRLPSALPPVPSPNSLPPISAPSRAGSGSAARSMPPLPPSASSVGARASASRETGANGFGAPVAPGSALTLVYNGERHPITKDRFVIGRGKQSSDLTLRDPNVSRQHAVVEFQNGVYFMVDMGSTNGVAFNGQRIARKPIDEGDVFRICDHDLHFTYQ